MAHLSEDPVLIETLHSQGDIFSQLASEWYIYTINLNSYSGDYYKGGGGGCTEIGNYIYVLTTLCNSYYLLYNV